MNLFPVFKDVRILDDKNNLTEDNTCSDETLE